MIEDYREIPNGAFPVSMPGEDSFMRKLTTRELALLVILAFLVSGVLGWLLWLDSDPTWRMP